MHSAGGSAGWRLCNGVDKLSAQRNIPLYYLQKNPITQK